MAKIKTHLESLVRIQPDNEARESCLRLDLNENIAGLPAEFVRGVLNQVDADVLATYPKYQALKKKIGMADNLSQDNICLGNGSDGAIKYIYDTFIAAGDEVVVTDPTFAMYKVYADMFNAKVTGVPYNADFSFPLDEFVAALSNGPKLAVVVNPNNPTGTAISVNDVKAIVGEAEKRNTLVIVDEAYHYFCDVTAMPLVADHPNLIVLRTFSKLCALASTRIGYAAGNEQIIRNIEKVKPTYDVNGLGVLFAEALLDEPQVIAQMISRFREAKHYLNDRLREAGVGFRSGEANFTLIDVGCHVEPVMNQLAEAGVLVGGKFSGSNLSNFIRVTIGDIEDMQKFLDIFLRIREDLSDE